MNEPDEQPGDAIPEELAQVKRVRSAPRATIGALLLLGSVISLWVSRDGWRYSLKSSTPVDLGRAEDAVSKGTLRHNTYVTLTARPILEAEGRLEMGDSPPGCLGGPRRKLYLTLLAETGDHLVLRSRRSLKKQQAIPKRVRLQGRLLRLDSQPDTQRMYRRFLYRLTDCRTRPRDCNRSLLIGADIAKETLLPQLGRKKAVLKGKAGYRIEVKRTTPLFLMFRYPDQWDYHVSKVSKAEAIEQVKTLGVPWIYTESRREDHYFVLMAPRAKAERWIHAQRRGKGYGISQRTAGFLTTFGRLRRQGEGLIIRKVGPGFPEDYRVVPAQAAQSGATLQAVLHEGHVRVPLARFVKASYHGPRNLPDSAWLLVEGRRPGDARPAALLAAGALLVGLLGLVLLILGLRRPR